MNTTRSAPATGGSQPPNPKRQKVTNAEGVSAAGVGVARESSEPLAVNSECGASSPVTDILGNAIELSNSSAPGTMAPTSAQAIGANAAVLEQVGHLGSNVSPVISASAACLELQELLEKQKAEVKTLMEKQATQATAASLAPGGVTLPGIVVSAAAAKEKTSASVGNGEGDVKMSSGVSLHDTTTDVPLAARNQVVATAASTPQKMITELLALAQAGVPSAANDPLSRLMGHVQSLNSAEAAKASQPRVVAETPNFVVAMSVPAASDKVETGPAKPALPSTLLGEALVTDPTSQVTPGQTVHSLSVAASAAREGEETSVLRAENQRLRELVLDHEYAKDTQTGVALMSVLRYCNKPNIDTINAVAARRSARARGQETEKDLEDMRILITSAARHVALQEEVQKKTTQAEADHDACRQTETVRRLQAMQRCMQEGLDNQQSEVQRVACSGRIKTLEQERAEANDPANHKKSTVARIDPTGPHEPVFATPQNIADIAMQQKTVPLFGERQSDQQVTVRDVFPAAAAAAAAGNASLGAEDTDQALAASAATSVLNGVVAEATPMLTPMLTPIDTLSSVISLGDAPSNFQTVASSQPTRLDNVLSNILGPVTKQHMRDSMRSSMDRFMR